MRYTVKPLDESTWNGFAALVEANNGVFGGCWCMGFHPEEDSHADAPEPKRERKLDRVRAGTTHAALVFDGEDCVGWCQFGAPAEVPRIKNRKEYEKELVELPDWRIACNFVGKGHRRQGGHRRPGRSARVDRRSGRRPGRGLPRTGRRRTGRVPLPRSPLNLREGRIHQGPPDRKTPLGRDQGRQTIRPLRGTPEAVRTRSRRRSGVGGHEPEPRSCYRYGNEPVAQSSIRPPFVRSKPHASM
jgi:hypothetical protein